MESLVSAETVTKKKELLLVCHALKWVVVHGLLVFSSSIFAQAPTPDPGAQLDYHRDVLPLLTRYCSDCHSGDSPSAGVDFEKLKIEHAATTDRNVWSKVLVQLENKIMPPPDSEQPTGDEMMDVIHWIQSQAMTVNCDGPRFAGRVTLKRLNRDEYNRTIRDLIGVDFQPADNFPSDDVGYGFDNIGDVLSLPPVLLERYIDAADEVVRRAIVVAERDFAPGQSLPGGSLASVGERSGTVHLPVSADYLFRIKAYQDQAGPEAAQMDLLVDGKSLKVFSVDAKSSEPGLYEIKKRLVRGQRQVAFKFLNDYYDPNNADPKLRGDRNLHVLSVELVGPIGTLPEDLPESHRHLLRDSPPPKSSRETKLKAIQSNLNRFIPRALRRKTNQEELARYVKIGETVLDDGASFERAMQVAIQAVLVSPHFLFRVERGPLPDGPLENELSEFELATRLSYFLWSSTPDDSILSAAATGKLKDPTLLNQQVLRMLESPKSDALVQNFAGQWLQLRKLETVSVDTARFPEFTAQLRAAMRRETELLVETVIREDRNIFDLLTADYTFVNESLAKLYQLDQAVVGEEFQKVSLVGTNRSGLLGHASFLTVTSNPTRTSPVKRGKWILDNLLAAPPPPAPPNVPSLENTAKDSDKPVSLREQMEIHRSNPTCAGCHQLMDPLGFGLENYDAIGRWRDADGDVTIDSRGALPDGRAFDGPIELRNTLMASKAKFRRCLASKLLTYAIGRGLEYFDECTLDDICSKVEAEGDKFSALVRAIVDSRPFRWQARVSSPQ